VKPDLGIHRVGISFIAKIHFSVGRPDLHFDLMLTDDLMVDLVNRMGMTAWCRMN
jgi:hypothetical protein